MQGKREEDSGIIRLYRPRIFAFISKTHHIINEFSTEKLQQFVHKSKSRNLMLVSQDKNSTLKIRETIAVFSLQTSVHFFQGNFNVIHTEYSL